MYGWMDGWMDGWQKKRWINEWREGRMDGWMEKVSTPGKRRSRLNQSPFHKRLAFLLAGNATVKSSQTWNIVIITSFSTSSSPSSSSSATTTTNSDESVGGAWLLFKDQSINWRAFGSSFVILCAPLHSVFLVRSFSVLLGHCRVLSVIVGYVPFPSPPFCLSLLSRHACSSSTVSEGLSVNFVIMVM